jgi:hypothetical protein
MSKMDDMRAMREARYEQRSARTSKPVAAPPKPELPAAMRVETPDPSAGELDTESLCGHRAISGRTCTRERGHSAKSHRYA